MTTPDRTPPPEAPTDPDLKWTGWALEALRETVEIDLRAKRVVERQMAIPGEAAPDAAVMQARLSRSVRLSIAMTERIRTDYLMRRDGRVQSGEQGRRRQRREQAAQAVAEAIALPDAAGDTAESIERERPRVWERLVEDEILDVRIDILSPDEFVQAVCRKIGTPPNPDWMPRGRGWNDGDAHGADDAMGGLAGVSQEPAGAESGVVASVVVASGGVDIGGMDIGAGDGWAGPAEAVGKGGLSPRLPTPDSS